MTKHTVVVDLDDQDLPHVDDGHLALLWHVAQANPAAWGEPSAGLLASKVGHEIIRRWLRGAPLELFRHQEVDQFHKARIDSLPEATQDSSVSPTL